MRKVGRSSRHIIHTIAHCEDCEFQEELWTTAAREATRHTRKTGHTVAIEVGIVYRTYAKEEAANE